MTRTIKKIVFDLNLEDNNFYPLSRSVPKELIPLGNIPIIEHFTKQIDGLGVEEIIFLCQRKDRNLIDFFEKREKAEKELKESESKTLSRFKSFNKRYEDISFSFIKELKELSVGTDSFAFINPREIIFSETGILEQMMKVFRTSERPVIAIRQKEKGDVKVEKIARRLYKVEEFDKGDFEFLKGGIFTAASFKFFTGNSVEEALVEMINKGHTVYGVEIEGRHFSLEDELSLSKAGIYYLLKGSELSEDLKSFIKENGLI